MIAGAAQADVALLVISARKGEFETGFEKGGQTREHIMLVKTAGVQKVVVVINKMDDPTVEWSKERYDEIKDKLTPFVKSAGFSLKTDVTFLPVSAYTGVNMKDRADKQFMPWWEYVKLTSLRIRRASPSFQLAVRHCSNYSILCQWSTARQAGRS